MGEEDEIIKAIELDEVQIADENAKLLYKDQEKCICSNTIPEIENKNAFFETEIIPNLIVSITEDNKVRLSEILQKLKECGYPLTGSMISVFLPEIENYVLIGNDPLDQGIFLEENILQDQNGWVRQQCL